MKKRVGVQGEEGLFEKKKKKKKKKKEKKKKKCDTQNAKDKR